MNRAAIGPYDGPHEHLADLLARHDWLLRREFARGHPRKPTDVLGFAAITEDEVDFLLNRIDPPKDGGEPVAKLCEIEQAVDRLARRIDSRVSQTLACKQRLPVIELACRFALSALEIDIVVACLAAEVDRRYERIYGYLQDDMTHKLPSPGLVLALVCDSPARQLAARAALNPLAPLRHYRIIEIADDGGASPWLSKPMRIDERIVAFLLGDQSMDWRIASYVTRLDYEADSIGPAGSQQDELDALVEQAVECLGAAQNRQRPVVYLHGAGNVGAAPIVHAFARHLKLPVMAVEAEQLCAPGLDFEQSIFLLFREGLLSQAALFLHNVDRVLDADPGGLRHRALFRCATEMGSIVFLSGERPWHWPLPPQPVLLRPFELRPAGFVDQLQAWRALTNAKIADADLHRLMSLYPLPLGAIGVAWRMACGLADLESADRSITIADLEQACRAQAGVPASGLARRIEPKHDWGDIVLPLPQLEQLHAICSQAKHASTVYGAWCFERKLSLGKGLSALFSGPPGTGKTMAAEVIAADLKVELLKIDLSQIVSKYIGETEKNLRQLFDQAAAAHAILFFDEADALLGKRSAVKDAHDRYANTEIAYLLQKMEEYDGIAILATNLRQNMDEAFTRRLRFIVEFPFPEEEDRLRIWNTVWPKEVPLAQDVDLQVLAGQFRLSGGSIRNVALAAAFLAAEQNEPVAMRHLVLATKRELQKMGRLVSEQGAP
jgi:ATPase family associated with various cellular activities (AAA)